MANISSGIIKRTEPIEASLSSIESSPSNDYAKEIWGMIKPTVDTSLPFAGANRVIQGAKDRGSNLEVTISPTGTTEIRNLPGVATSSTEPPKEAFTMDALRSKQAEILSTQDTGEKFNKLAALN